MGPRSTPARGSSGGSRWGAGGGGGRARRAPRGPRRRSAVPRDAGAGERAGGGAPLGGGVRVRTDRGTYEAEKLVVTAGAWDGELGDVVDGLAVPARTGRRGAGG